MNAVNRVAGAVVEGMLYPFRGLPPFWGVLVVSLVVGAAMLLVFKATSNQKRIKSVKNRMTAGIYEIRLLNDDLAAVLKAQAGILKHNLVYFRLSLVPLAWMILPFVVVIAQLQSHYGYRGLEPGETALLEVDLRDDWRERAGASGTSRPEIALETPGGVRAESPGVWIPAHRQVVWRIASETWGDHEVAVTLGGERVVKRVHVSRDAGRRSPYRSAGFVDQVLYPGEPGIPSASPIRKITVSYEDASIDVLGVGLHWIIVFFVLSIVAAFLLKGRMGVTI